MRYTVTVNGEAVELELNGSELVLDGEVVHGHVAGAGEGPMRLVRLGDRVHHVVARRDAGAGRGRYTLWVDGWRYDVEALDERTKAIRELSKASAGAAGPAPLIAPMPGLVVRVHVDVGDDVQPGQPLVVMEAMKMENELRAQAPGRVKAVHAKPGTAVEKGMVLLELE